MDDYFDESKREPLDLTPELIQERREWIARRKAHLDQLEKRIDAQFPLRLPVTNLREINNLEALRFWISIHEWELDEQIKELNDSDDQTGEED